MITYETVYPSNYSPSEALPLVAFFPGHKGNAMKFKKLFAASHKARRFIGVYFNTPDGGWNMADHWHEIEKTLIDAADSATEWYAVGISNGACLALQMTAILSFGAAATFAGSLFTGDMVEFNPLRRVLMFNGVLDKSVPYSGGRAHGVDMTGAFGTFQKFHPGPYVQSNLTINGKLYSSPADYIQLYRIEEAGHDVYAYLQKKGWDLPGMCLDHFQIPVI